MDNKVFLKGVSMNDKEFNLIISNILINPEILRMNGFRQHYNVSTFEHAYKVSYYMYKICKKLGLDYVAGARAGLLHDFYLYDRYAPREQTHRKGLHGFTHPRVAKENANKYFDISEKEENIILSHMWPLTFFSFPRSKEAWLIVRIDKQIVRKESKIKGPVYQFKIIKENVNV